MTHPTQKQLESLIELVNTLYQIIQSFGEQGLPSGHLYAMTMHCFDLATYEACIAMLVRVGLVQRHGFVLVARDGDLETARAKLNG